MSAPQSPDPIWVAALGRVYAGALWLYPPSHRKRWGADMRLAFRDRCREAARAGRGPWSVLFTELLPDLAATVGSEHIDNYVAEANPMKRLLIVLIVTFVAVVLLHAQVTPAMDAAHAWWRHRENVAYDRAYSAHLEAVAQATEQQRQNAHADVAAAIVYWNAPSDGPSWRPTYQDGDHGAGDGSVPDALDPVANNALRDRADAAFARALKADDRWALWLAVAACPARKAVCARDASFARLRQIDADNGAVWLLDMQDAQKAHDVVRTRTALASLARSTRFDSHDGDAMRALLLAFDVVPVPSRLVVDNEWVHATAAESAPLLASALAHNGYMGDSFFQGLKPSADFCRSGNAQERAERQVDCRAAGKLMAEQGSLWLGYRQWMRNADSGELEPARTAFRDFWWQQSGGMGRLASLTSAGAISAWKTAWLAGSNASDVNRRLMLQQGIALNASADFDRRFHTRPDQYDPPAN